MGGYIRRYNTPIYQLIPCSYKGLLMIVLSVRRLVFLIIDL